eukprot:6042430-Pleurochrysis_carterae.AAC.1
MTLLELCVRARLLPGARPDLDCAPMERRLEAEMAEMTGAASSGGTVGRALSMAPSSSPPFRSESSPSPPESAVRSQPLRRGFAAAPSSATKAPYSATARRLQRQIPRLQRQAQRLQRPNARRTSKRPVPYAKIVNSTCSEVCADHEVLFKQIDEDLAVFRDGISKELVDAARAPSPSCRTVVIACPNSYCPFAALLTLLDQTSRS